jgi:DUF1009 family protein
MHEAGASALAIEAGRAVVFNRNELIDLANLYDIAVIAQPDP